jgi:pimeloyl-ACP methyl ester carboxylesterase
LLEPKERAMATVKVHDGELAYTDQGSGRPLLLVHGFPLDGTMWSGQTAPLAERFRVLVPDLRGFGNSSVLPGLVTMQRMADDLAEMLAALEVSQPVIFCGLSMGGYVAWQFALRHRQHLSRLILCDTRAAADSDETAANRIGLAQRVLKEGPSFVAEAMLPKLFAKTTIETGSPVVEATRQVILRTDPKGISAAARGMAQRRNVTELLPQIDLPTLLICGEHDAITPPDEMKSVAEKLPQATYVQIAGAGHMAPLEKPTEVNQAILEFCQ